ncbi:hypothetical protein [Streptomyces caatingaensis]|uniref:hypothetical protein n=1 Tax=Streptomyces caatingaensis TaxID=1678637 RepID=UPI0012FEE9BD|nr:hypothetical protein [Streptomyces caatingaensis]
MATPVAYSDGTHREADGSRRSLNRPVRVGMTWEGQVAMCSKCFNVGYINEQLQNGTRLVHPCPACNKAESDNREPRRQPAWLSRLSGADKSRAK